MFGMSKLRRIDVDPDELAVDAYERLKTAQSPYESADVRLVEAGIANAQLQLAHYLKTHKD